ncbi:MAG TPA: ArgE/DapE family deacylase [Gemmatimonadaceae bacterium]|nr:ArgE/DapE family deacylase [Gemmatimonadaceae bacterium]
MTIAPGDAVALTRELVAIDSRNPALVPDGPGEAAVAQLLGSVLEEWGFRVELRDAAPGRPNVIARIGDGMPNMRTLMFNGHLDVVGTDGMVHAPWVPRLRDGRLYGRGSADMKAGVAAMCAAASRAGAGSIPGEIVVTAVVDEEYQSLGTSSLVASGVRADAAIVTEPTRLCIMPAHKGFVWMDLVAHGRAAHGSRWDVGVDAIRHAALALAELDAMDHEVLPQRSHALLGRPSLHAASIAGGSGLSTYPERCRVTIERRTIPGETAEAVMQELASICDRVRARQPDARLEIGMLFAQPPSDVPVDAPIVRALDAALRSAGEEVRITGMSAWTDAAVLNDAGIPAICFGPGDIVHAHAAEEYVETEEIRRATAVLARLAAAWCSQSR